MPVDLSELERFDSERPQPPPILYKYVAADRLDVLEKASIRFTPPLNTNDIFEVRQTVDLMMGPKMEGLFSQMADELNFEETLRKALDDGGLGSLSNSQAKMLLSSIGGGDAESVFRQQMKQFLGMLPSLLNSPEKIEAALMRSAAKQLLLSLSERPDSSPMWAHYAANSKGFVIAFDTTSTFFRRGKDDALQGLHKVRYFDGRVREIMDDPYAALISKQADWSYEREWRLYVSVEDVTEVISAEQDIHLVSFPRHAVQRVILGVQTGRSLGNRIQQVLSKHYSSVELTRMVADRSTAKLKEIPAEP